MGYGFPGGLIVVRDSRNVGGVDESKAGSEVQLFERQWSITLIVPSAITDRSIIRSPCGTVASASISEPLY